MTDQPATTAGTWAPDWRALKRTRDKAIVSIPYANDDQFNEAAYGAIVAEWSRQAAAAGWIMVRREDLLAWIDDEIDLAYEEGLLAVGDEGAEEWTQELRNYVKRLAATPAAAPGGDAG